MVGFITRRRLGTGVGATLLAAALAACSPGSVRGVIPSRDTSSGTTNRAFGLVSMTCPAGAASTAAGNCSGFILGVAGGKSFTARNGSGGFSVSEGQDCTAAPCTNPQFFINGPGRLGGAAGYYGLVGGMNNGRESGFLVFGPTLQSVESGQGAQGFNFSCTNCLHITEQPGHTGA